MPSPSFAGAVTLIEESLELVTVKVVWAVVVPKVAVIVVVPAARVVVIPVVGSLATA